MTLCVLPLRSGPQVVAVEIPPGLCCLPSVSAHKVRKSFPIYRFLCFHIIYIIRVGCLSLLGSWKNGSSGVLANQLTSVASLFQLVETAGYSAERPAVCNIGPCCF